MTRLKTRNVKIMTHKGITLIEMLVVLAIFSVVMAGLYSAYVVQMRAGVKEYRLAESDMEFQIGKFIIERDLAMAGYGLPLAVDPNKNCGKFAVPGKDTTCASGWKCGAPVGFCVPVPVSATDGGADTLTIMGTALGRGSKAAQTWSYAKSDTRLRTWGDSRETLESTDRIIFINQFTNEILTTDSAATAVGQTWLFPYQPPSTGVTNDYDTETPPSAIDMGAVVYGMYKKTETTDPEASFPYYVVQYYMGGTAPSLCAPGTQNLERRERRTDSGDVSPIFNCVLDFQVAFALDMNEDGKFEPYAAGSDDCWDNGGSTAATLDPNTLALRLKQLRVYALVQQGPEDKSYISPEKIRIGDALLTACGGGAVGREFTFSDPRHRNYRWKVISASVWPRNAM